MNKRHRQQNNTINAGSMADIAFLLLIFFLLATQIKIEKGIHTNLPKWSEPQSIPTGSSDRYFYITVNAAEEIMINQKIAELDDVKHFLKAFLSSSDYLPVNVVVSLKISEEISYETYISIYNQLLVAYKEKRNEYSILKFKVPIKQIDDELKYKEIERKIPIRISEAEIN